MGWRGWEGVCEEVSGGGSESGKAEVKGVERWCGELSCAGEEALRAMRLLAALY